MDIEKLIEKANHLGMELKRDGGEFEYSIGKKFLEYATALSTLQTKNAQLRESRDHWKRLAHELSEGVNGKDAEHERLRAENEKLRAELERMKGIMRYNGIMVIPSKYPGGRSEWNIPKPRGQKED